MSCAKCGSPDVHVIAIGRSATTGTRAIATGTFTSAKVDHHVCTSCGYIESYVDPAERAKIAEKWPLAKS